MAFGSLWTWKLVALHRRKKRSHFGSSESWQFFWFFLLKKFCHFERKKILKTKFFLFFLSFLTFFVDVFSVCRGCCQFVLIIFVLSFFVGGYGIFLRSWLLFLVSCYLWSLRVAGCFPVFLSPFPPKQKKNLYFWLLELLMGARLPGDTKKQKTKQRKERNPLSIFVSKRVRAIPRRRYRLATQCKTVALAKLLLWVQIWERSALISDATSASMLLFSDGEKKGAASSAGLFPLDRHW